MEFLKSPASPWLYANRNNRRLTLITITFAVVIVAQAVALVSLFPLKKVVPVYVEFKDGGSNFVVVQRAEGEISANQNLISMFLRSYVVSRETVDKITEKNRYQYVMSLSGEKVASNFRRLYGDKSTGLYFQDGLKRAVHVVRDNPLGRGIHQVEIETVDTNDAKAGETRADWIVTIQYAFNDQRAKFDERLQNPMGIFIEEYSLTKRKTQ